MTADLLCRYLAGLSLNDEYTAEERLHFLSEFLTIPEAERIDSCEVTQLIFDACYRADTLSLDIETTGRDTLYGVERATFPFWRNRAADGNARGLRDILDDGHEFRVSEIAHPGREIAIPVPVDTGRVDRFTAETLLVPVGSLVTDSRAPRDTIFTRHGRAIAILVRGTGRTVVDLPRHLWDADPARIRRRGDYVYFTAEGTVGGYTPANWLIPRYGTAPGDYFVYNTAADFGGEGE